MTPDEFKSRTKSFAIETIRFARSCNGDVHTRDMVRQLVRSATSVGANYRAACLARSDAEMRAKLRIVAEEADECHYWFELLQADGVNTEGLCRLMQESSELLAMTTASIRSLNARVGVKDSVSPYEADRVSSGIDPIAELLCEGPEF